LREQRLVFQGRLVRRIAGPLRFAAGAVQGLAQGLALRELGIATLRIRVHRLDRRRQGGPRLAERLLLVLVLLLEVRALLFDTLGPCEALLLAGFLRTQLRHRLTL
jgi:hypothetical protein